MYFDLYHADVCVGWYLLESHAIEAVKEKQTYAAFKAFQKAHDGSTYLSKPFVDARSGMGRKG
jgi:hypothetical protein